MIDAKGGHVYPGFINARTTVGIGENGVRGYDDVSEMHDWNQQLRTRVGLPLRERHDPGRARQRHHDGRRGAGRRDHVGRVRGHEPRRLDVGRGDAARRTPASSSTSRRSAAAADAAAVAVAAAPARRADRTYDDMRRERDRRLDEVIRVFDQARAYAEGGRGQDASTGTSKRWCRSSNASCRSSSRSRASRTSRTPSRSPSAPR